MVSSLWISTITLSLTALILLYKYFTRNFDYWKKRNVPYIKPIPFIGSLLSVFEKKQALGEWVRDLCQNMNEDYFGIFVFDRPVLIVQSPKLARAVLQREFSHFQDRSVGCPERDPIISNLMFFSKNPKWKMVRGTVTPAFTSAKLKLMFPLALDESEAMAEYIRKLVNIPNIESKEICAKYATNVISRCAFGVNSKSFEKEDAEFRKLGKRMIEFRYANMLRQVGSWLTPTIMNTFGIGFFDYKCVTRLKDIFIEVLHSRMSSACLKGLDLVDILLEANKNNKSECDENAMVGQAIMFFSGALETISNILSLTLYELSLQPNIQTRLRTEILGNTKENNGITYKGISEMKYLHMCISETLRKYPLLPFLDRVCKSSYKLEDTDLIIEEGIPVYVAHVALHYDPKLYPEPEKFDPERFSDKSNINKDGLFYIPFGEGPRMCIGNQFGLMTMKLGLVSILSKYSLEATDKTPVPIKFANKCVLLESTVGIPLKYVPI